MDALSKEHRSQCSDKGHMLHHLAIGHPFMYFFQVTKFIF